MRVKGVPGELGGVLSGGDSGGGFALQPSRQFCVVVKVSLMIM